jgi:capsular polysaccharide transport system permease protein
MNVTTRSLPNSPEQMSGFREFGLALRNWATVIGLLMVEYVNNSRAGKFSFIFVLVEPFILIVGMYIYRGWFKGGTTGFGTSYFLFLSAGLLPYYMFVRTASTVRRGQQDTAKRLPRISSLDLFIGTAAANGVVWVIVISLALSGMWFYGIKDARPQHIDQCALAVLILFLGGTGFGLLNSAISRYFPMWQIIMAVCLRGLAFLSGVMQIADLYRLNIRVWVVWNPILHGVDWFKVGLYGNYPHMLMDRGYLLKCTLILVFLGIVLDRATLRYGTRK